MIKTVIFDMDGVIFDTENLILQNWQELAVKHGYDMEEIKAVFTSCIGTNAAATKKIVLTHYGKEFPYEEFREEASKLFYAKVERDGMPVKKGVKELLLYLKAKQYKVGLASSTRRASVLKELGMADLLQYFDVVIGGDMVANSKPEPDVFLKCCEELAVQPEEAYIIEDSYNGIRAAKKAGAIPIMVPDLLAPDEEMQNLSFKILPSLVEVKEYLEM